MVYGRITRTFPASIEGASWQPERSFPGTMLGSFQLSSVSNPRPTRFPDDVYIEEPSRHRLSSRGHVRAGTAARDASGSRWIPDCRHTEIAGAAERPKALTPQFGRRLHPCSQVAIA